MEKQIDLAAMQHAEIQRSEAIARLDDYEKMGLENSEANFAHIKDFVERSGKNWGAQIVDVAVKSLAKRLKWQPEPPTQFLEPLKSGERRLALNADEKAQKRASTAQLHDLLARRRAASGQVYGRGIGRISSNLL
jgi:hypothetical protein